MQMQIVDFDEKTEDQKVAFGSQPDPTFDYGSLSGIYDLKDWFSRPIPIYSYNWAQDTNLNFSIHPWWNYFGTSSVTNKLLGYSRLRCTLHVKLVINSTPFAYSMGLMSYRPLGDDATPSLSFSGGNIDPVSVSTNLDSVLVARTQRPCAYFNPQDQRGCTMELPFIKQDNWIMLINTGPPPVVAQGWDTQLRNMGTLNFDSFVPLTMSNATTGQSVEITVYAWATDVELMGPTACFQSGKGDEYGTSPVSDVATAVAAASNALEGVSSLAPYARATSMVMTGVSAVAKALGYSKPPNIAPVAPYRYLTNPSVANSSVPVPCDVLAIDPKAELTIDPRTVCVGDKDQNLISNIIQKDTYWFTTTWEISDPTNYELARIYVTPEIYRSEQRIGAAAGAPYWVRQVSPLCHLAQAFGYWQGDLIYTFRFVCSKFHRGRVRIFYEPENSGTPIMNSGYNINHVVDLGSTTTFEMRVPYMRTSAWARLEHLAALPGSDNAFRIRNAGGFFAQYNRESMNGVIYLTVLNDLSAPSITADVSVLVSVRAAENFSFAQPKAICPLNEQESDIATTWTGELSYESLAQYQSGSRDEPNQEHEMAVSIPAPVPQMDPFVFMGEKIVSLKQLFARACHYVHLGAEATPNGFPGVNRPTIVTWTHPRFPRQYGPDSSGLHACTHSRDNNYGYNFVNHTFLSWFVPAFVGWRGSIVWRMQPFDIVADYDGASGLGMECIHRSGCHIERFPVRTMYQQVTTSPVGTRNLSGVQVARIPTSTTVSGGYFSRFYTQEFKFMNGTSAAAPEMEPVNIAAVPMYSAYRMHPCNPSLMSHSHNPDGEPLSYDTDYSSDNVRFSAWGNTALHDQNHIANPFALFVAGGDDFTPFLYLNAPTFYVGSAGGYASGAGFQKPALYATY